MISIDDMWGKSTQNENPTYWPLIHHMIDTMNVTQAMWDMTISPQVKKRVASYLSISESDARSWIGFWAGLHDIGKATPGFQLKSEMKAIELRKNGYLFPVRLSGTPHGLMSSIILREMFSLGEYAVPRDLSKTIYYALGGHHGIYPSAHSMGLIPPSEAGDDSWNQVRLLIVKCLADESGVAALPSDFQVSHIDNAFFVLLSGLTSVSDWIASSEDFFGSVDHHCGIKDYSGNSAACAKTALTQLRWGRVHEDGIRPFSEVFPEIKVPYPLQERAIELSPSMTEPGMVIVEAPMGEGKTETAFYLAESWSDLCGLDSLYIALPTQATADQMFSRMRKYLEGSGKRVNLVLLHGHAVLNNDYLGMRIDSDDDDNPLSIATVDWFTYRKRGVLSPYGVGTIDQALLGVLPTKHFFVRLFGLSGKVVVIDEVHSYDVYMSNLLLNLITWLSALGSSVILLSATLPSRKRKELTSAFLGRDSAIETTSYPRISWVVGEKEGNISFDSSSSSRGLSRVNLRWIENGSKQIAECIQNSIVEGGAVAVICNTVSAAQQMYRGLKAHFLGQDVDIDLLHARYPYECRKERQDRIIANFDKRVRPGNAKRIVVATQILEQSLDLDFDLMITELAPSDLVLQRMGRLHRHIRDSRPPLLSKPELLIIRPKMELHGIPDFGASKYIYAEYILLRSYLALIDMDHVDIPNDIDRLVEETYSEVETQVMSKELADYLMTARTKMVRDEKKKEDLSNLRVIPGPTSENPWRATEHLLLEDESAHRNLQAMTRETRPSVAIVCLFNIDGQPCLDAEGKNKVDLEKEANELDIRRLLDRTVAIHNQSVVRDLMTKPSPPGWRKSSILQNHHPAIFSRKNDQEWICDFGGRVSMVLSQELGILFTEGDNDD